MTPITHLPFEASVLIVFTQDFCIAQHTDKELWLRFAFKGIRPGQIPQMIERVGLRLLAIKRIRIGRIPMGDLAVGEWRYLPVYKRF